MTNPAHARSLDDLLEHREWLRAIARGLVADENDVDDVEQRTWLTVLRNRRTVTSARGWLRRVVHSAAVDEHRCESRRHAREERSARPEALPSTDHLVMQLEAQRTVAKALMGLPEPYRTTVLLRYIEELSVKDVATRMAVPVKTVKTRLHRALALLRDALDREYGDRRGWCAALLPVLRLSSPSTAATGAAVATGVLLMGTKAKVAAAVVVLALCVGAAWLSGDGRRSTREIETANAPQTGAVSRPRTSAAAPVPQPPAVARGALEFTVRDWEGWPVPDATGEVRPAAVEAYGQANDTPTAAPVGAGRTGADGRARVEGLEVLRDLELVVRAQGRARATRTFLVSDETHPVHLDVMLLTECRLTGRVLDTGGSPVPGAVVDVFASAEVRAGRAAADANGRYVVSELPHGQVEVSGARPGEAAAYSAIEARAVSTRVELPFERDLDLVLRPSARIAGTVRDARSGQPIAAAEVRMFANTGGRAGGPATTDAAGRYLITNLCDCVVDEIQVRAPGYSTSPRRVGGPTRGSFVARPGESVTCDLALEPSTSAAPVGDPPGGVIEGRVLSLDGKPVPGARVGDVKVGADGAFRIESAAAGRETTWLVQASGWASADLTATAPPRGEVLHRDVVLRRAPRVTGTISTAEGVPPPEGTLIRIQVIVESGTQKVGAPGRFMWSSATADATGRYECELPWAGPGRFFARVSVAGRPVANSALVDLDLGASEYHLDVALAAGASLWGTSLSGHVLDAATGVPIAGARIVMGEVVATTTGTGGEFEVRGLPTTAAYFDATVVAAGYTTFVTPRFIGWVPGRDNVSRLDRLLTISGTVAWDDLTPVAGVVLSTERGAQQTTSGADGRFVLRDVPAGVHQIRVERPDAQSVVLDGIAAGTQDVGVFLKRGASISGRVVGADGRGVPLAGIYGQPTGKDAPVFVTRTGADGAFTLDGLAPGSSYVLNVAPPVAPTAECSDPDRYLHTPVFGVVADTQDLEIRLKEGLVIEGALVDESGAPLGDVSLVAAYDPHWQARTAVTDAQGRFRFRGLQQIAYAIRISTPAAGIVEVQGGESVAPGTTDARLVAIAGGTLSGVVVDEQNHALRDAMVTVSAGDKTQSARTSRDGTFEVRDLRREPCTVHVDVVGYVPQSLGGVTPGGAPVRIALAGGLEVFGRLIKSDGTPQRARLDFRHPESDLLSRQTWTDESGCFRLSGFVDARYEVIAVAGSALIVDVGGVTPGTGTEIELRLP